MVQLNFTPEIEVFYSTLFERSLSIFSMTSLKQHIRNTSISGIKSSLAALYITIMDLYLRIHRLVIFRPGACGAVARSRTPSHQVSGQMTEQVSPRPSSIWRECRA